MNQDQAREYVKKLQMAGPDLERVRHGELRNFRHEEHIGEIHSLMELGGLTAQSRPTSGLVEQQRLFQKA